MGGDLHKVEEMVARLAADPAFASFAQPGAGILVWDAAVDRLLWASPAASYLRDAFADLDGRVLPSLVARDRLKILAAGLAPNRGMRLERLRLDPSRLNPPVTCACRVAALNDGRAVLVTAIVGAVPVPPIRARQEPELTERIPEPESARPLAAGVEQSPKPRGNVRFVWQADAETRFTQVSPTLAEVVGPMAADIVGRTWEEVSRSVVEDPNGVVAALLAARRTFSGQPVSWLVDNTSLQVPVDWAGMPIFGADRTLAGYRGFGLLRTDSMRERPPAGDDATAAPEPDLTSGQPSDERDEAPDLDVLPGGKEPPVTPVPLEQRDRSAKLEAPSSLSMVERSAFREIAKALGARFEGEPAPPAEPSPATDQASAPPPAPAPAAAHGDRAVADATERLRQAEIDLRLCEARIRELESILDTATDGVVLVDETGRILSLNRSAEALFGYDQCEVVGDLIPALLAPESHKVALDYLKGLSASGVASLLNDGREVMGRVRQGGTIPLFMTMGYVNEGPDRTFCAVLRDMTAFKKTEGELVAARHAAEEASAQKSDVLAKISHEIRTPLNAIIGFAEVMLEERFGPIGNDRYKDYLRDVHASGAHVISLVNDLLDLAKIEAGRMELSFKSVSLNELVSSCVMLLQPQAGRDRIVMRTSFAQKLPLVVADERSVRQIVLNLVSNAIKFTDAGGQVIVSTAISDRGEVAFRVRDTGIGMTEQEIEAALEPFRQLATSRKRGGTGLGLPLTKALVEANRGALQISSNPNDGTLVEVIFPQTRVLAG